MPTFPDNQIGELSAVMGRADSSVPNIIKGLTEPANGNLHQFPSSSIQYSFVESYPMFRAPMQQERLISYNLIGQSDSVLGSVNLQQSTESFREAGHRPGVRPISGHPELTLPHKRKAITEGTHHNHRNPQKISSLNKKEAQVGPYVKALGVSQASAPKKKSMPNSSKPSASNRKVVQIEPVTNASRTASKKIMQPQVSPKGQTESQDSMRAKLRDSLASALALVSQEQEDSPAGKMKTANEAVETIQEEVRKDKPLTSTSTNGVAPLGPLMDENVHDSRVLSPNDGCRDDQKPSLSFHSKEIFGEASQTESFLGADFQCNSVLPGEDSLFSSGFYFKDDLLQGNGLSWVSDFNSHISEVKETAVKFEGMNEGLSSDVDGKIVQSPESLASEIEAELFKLFGGINKKYKEKGRSLLFNLKDRNNPELRERVMSGDIPPDRLCAMTAEELASKELSQWRIAKAEELDHMKVLPETDGNMRRLVKKTHKGEYQVDFEPDGGASEEIPLSVSMAPSKRRKVDTSDAKAPKAERTKADECEITIPNEGADMQGLMVDDVKDLPPVISLDEFMESLDNEPPFENLPVDSVTAKAEPVTENVEDKKSCVESPKYPVQKMSPERVEDKKESPKSGGDKKSTSPKGFGTNSAVELHQCENVWEGQLQLNLSSLANFMALYKSGEKGSSKEWARLFDIKGRVRLAAFDKFLQALPMSRSRAIMVCHFVLKEGSTDTERTSLTELVDSYIADERLGFAEPGDGVELYLCAPRSTTVDMIISHLPKSYTDKLNDIDDGLIGIVVWRKVQITSSAMSPISSSQQKRVTKKQTGGQRVDNDTNRNTFSAPKRASPPPILSKSQPADDEDDDAPPGFGPPGPRDDDDLPEFQFSGGSHLSASSVPHPSLNLRPEMGLQHHPAPSRQVEQMRELIQKYGQNGNNADSEIPTEPWNDDDDDIPEWQPSMQQPVNPVFPTHFVSHQSHVGSHSIPQHQPWPQAAQLLQPLQPPMSVQPQRAWGPYGQESQFNGSPGPVSGQGGRDRRSNVYQSRNI